MLVLCLTLGFAFIYFGMYTSARVEFRFGSVYRMNLLICLHNGRIQVGNSINICRL